QRLADRITPEDVSRWEKEVFDASTKRTARNKYTGRFGELAVRTMLQNLGSKYMISEQVTVTFGKRSRRYVDFLVFDRGTRLPIAAIEVKTGGAIRSAAQALKDRLIGEGEGVFARGSQWIFGKSVELPTVVVSEDANMLGRFIVQ